MKKLLPLLFVFASLSGCVWVEDPADLRLFIREKLAAPAGSVEPLPEFKAYENFVYEGPWLRNPFVPMVPLVIQESAEEVVLSRVHPDFNRIKSYLEEFPVDQLVMVGTISSPLNRELIALVRDPNSEIHQVKVGDHLGLDYGEVVGLSEREISLTEIVADGRGGWINRPHSIELPVLK
jgi:type IV pilus assembly protein PilP